MLADNGGAPRWVDCWTHTRGPVPQPPTFRVHDKRRGPEPIACDFVFAARALADRARRIEVNTQTRVPAPSAAVQLRWYRAARAFRRDAG
jgi:hypothetical protein